MPDNEGIRSGFAELLTAELALERGLASADEVTAALRRYWSRRGERGASFLTELARIADLDPEAAERLSTEVRRRLEAGGGPAARGERLDLGAGMSTPLRVTDPDRYVDFQPIAAGGMGVVYLALDTELNRRVAFKVVRPDLGQGPAGTGDVPSPFEITPPKSPPGEGTPATKAFRELTRRFLQEAWVTGGLDHPGIVPVYELGQTPGGVAYYTMRFVRGDRTLEQAIDEAASIDDRLALIEPFLKLCDTVRYAHSQGVIHRDLKPVNVALGEFGEVVLLDWGLARMQDRPDEAIDQWQERLKEYREAQDMVTVAAALGTPGYMSPEAALGQTDRIDPRSDVYSLGVILYVILTGRMPFSFTTYGELVTQLRAGPPPAPDAVDPLVPPGLSRICLAALEPTQYERTDSVATLSRAIREWQTESARKREVEALVAEARAGLEGIEALDGEAQVRQLDRTGTHIGRVLELAPGHPEATALYERAKEVRGHAVELRESVARRQTFRRASAVAAVLLLLVAGIAAYLLDQRYREAEAARAAEADARADADRSAGEAREAAARAKRETAAKDVALRQARARTLLFVARDLAARDRTTEALALALEAWRLVPDDAGARDLCHDLERRPLEVGEIEDARYLAPVDEDTILVTGSIGLPVTLRSAETGEVLPGWDRRAVRKLRPPDVVAARALDDGRLALLDPDGRVVDAHVGRILAVAPSRDGSRILTAGWDQRARAWDAAGEKLLDLEGLDTWPVEGGAAILGDGKAYVVATESEILFWDGEGRLRSRMKFAVGMERAGYAGDAYREEREAALLFVPAGPEARVVAVDRNGQAWVFDARGRIERRLASGGFSKLLAAGPDRTTFAISSRAPAVAVVGVDGRLRREVEIPSPAVGASIDRDREHVVVWCEDGTAIDASLEPDRPVRPLTIDGTRITRAHALPGGAIAAAGEDGGIRLWSEPDRAEPLRLEPSFRGVRIIELRDAGTPWRLLSHAVGHSWWWRHAAAWDASGSPLANEFERWRDTQMFDPVTPGAVAEGTESIPFVWESAVVVRDRTGKVARVIEAPDGTRPSTCTTDPAGRRVAWLAGPTLVISDLSGEGETRIPLPPGESARGLRFTPDGRRLLAVTGHALTVYDAGDGTARTLPTAGQVGSLALSPSGRYVAVWPWRTQAGSALLALDGSEAPEVPEFLDAAFSPRADQLAIRTREGVRVVAVGSGERLVMGPPFRGEDYNLGWSRDGREVLATFEGRLRRLDLETETPAWSPPISTGHEWVGQCLLDRERNRMWFTTGGSGTPAILRELAAPVLGPAPAAGDAPAAPRRFTTFAPAGRTDGSLLVLPGAPGEVLFADGKGETKATLTIDSGEVRQVLFLDEGRRVALRLEDGTLKLLDEAATVVAETRVPEESRLHAAFGDRRLLVVAPDEVRILDADGRERARHGPAELGLVRPAESISQGPDGERLLVPLRSGFAEIGIDGAILRRFPGARSVAYARGGRSVVALLGDGRLVAVDTDRKERVLLTGLDPEAGFAVSPDGRTAATRKGIEEGWIVPLDGGAPRAVGPVPRAAEFAFLGDGGTLLASGRGLDSWSRLGLFAVDGRALGALRDHTKLEAISPRRDRVLVHSYGDDEAGLNLLDASGSLIARLPRVQGPTFLGWSPDGRRFAYAESSSWGSDEVESGRWLHRQLICDADGRVIRKIERKTLEPIEETWYPRSWISNRHLFLPAVLEIGDFEFGRGRRWWSLRDEAGEELRRHCYVNSRLPPVASPDGRWTAQADGLLVTVRRRDGTVAATVPAESRPMGLVVTPDGRGFVLGERLGRIRTFDWTGRETAAADVGPAVLATDVLASTGLLRVETRDACHLLRRDDARPELAVVRKVDGKIVGRGRDRTFVARGAGLEILGADGATVRSETFAVDVTAAAEASNGEVWVAGLADGELVVGTREGLRTIPAHGGAIGKVLVSPDGGAIVSRVAIDGLGSLDARGAPVVHTRVWSRAGELLREIAAAPSRTRRLSEIRNLKPLRFLDAGLLQSGDEYVFLDPEALARSLARRGVRKIDVSKIGGLDGGTAAPTDPGRAATWEARLSIDRLRVARDPRDPRARISLIAAAVFLGDLDAAAAESRAAAKALGGDPLDWMAASRDSAGEVSDFRAEPRIRPGEALARLRPESPLAGLRKAVELSERDRRREAAETFRAAWPEIEAMAPDERVPWLLEGIRIARLGVRYEDALALVDRLDALARAELSRPDARDYWREIGATAALQRAGTLAALGRAGAAAKEFRRSIALGREAADASLPWRLFAPHGEAVLAAMLADLEGRWASTPEEALSRAWSWRGQGAYDLAAADFERAFAPDERPSGPETRDRLFFAACSAALAATRDTASRTHWLGRAKEWLEASLVIDRDAALEARRQAGDDPEKSRSLSRELHECGSRFDRAAGDACLEALDDDGRADLVRRYRAESRVDEE